MERVTMHFHSDDARLIDPSGEVEGLGGTSPGNYRMDLVSCSEVRF
jgi:hypothetical protein